MNSAAPSLRAAAVLLFTAAALTLSPAPAFAEESSAEPPSIVDSIIEGLGGFFKDWVFDPSQVKKIDTRPIEEKAPLKYLKTLQNELTYQKSGWTSDPRPFVIDFTFPGINQRFKFELGKGVFDTSFSPWRHALTMGVIVVMVAAAARSFLDS